MIQVRVFTETEMGIWVIFLSVTTIVDVAKVGLIRNALIWYINGAEPEKHPMIKSASLMINLGFTVLIILAYWTSADFIGSYFEAPQLQIMIYLFFVNLCVLVPYSHFETILLAHSKFSSVFYVFILKQGVYLALVLCAWLGLRDWFTLANMVIFQAAGILVATVLSYFLVKGYLVNYFRIHKEWLITLWKYGRFSFMTSITSAIFTTTDQLMIGGMVSKSAAAFYNVSVRITNVMDMPSKAITDVLFPRAVKANVDKNPQNLRSFYERAVGAILALLIPLSIFILIKPDWIILLLAGDKYLTAIPILKVTIVYSLFFPFLKQFGVLINAIHKPNIDFYFVLGLAIFNVISNYLFIKAFGILGAAYGTLTSYCFGFIVSQIILRRELKVSTWEVLKNIPKTYLEVFTFIKSRISRQ